LIEAASIACAASHAGSMIVANLLVFAIDRFDMDFHDMKFGAGLLGFLHCLAVAALAFTTIGWFASLRRHQAYGLTSILSR